MKCKITALLAGRKTVWIGDVALLVLSRTHSTTMSCRFKNRTDRWVSPRPWYAQYPHEFTLRFNRWQSNVEASPTRGEFESKSWTGLSVCRIRV